MSNFFQRREWLRPQRWVRRWLLSLLLLTVSGLMPNQQPLLAQNGTFISGSNGSDGALNFTAPGTYIFDPATFNPPLDPDGDYVYHFTTITVAAGVTVTLKSPQLKAPLYWLATGDVRIDGVLDLNGQNGHPSLNGDSRVASRYYSTPGAGGYPGGVGPTNGSNPTSGSGPGGGNVGNFGGGTRFVGNDYLVPLVGGSGGGGGGDSERSVGGGAGGGALLIASSSSIRINGRIQANGGFAFSSGAGGGGGGMIHLLAPVIAVPGQLTAGSGRIRLDAFQVNISGGSFDTGPILGTPIKVYLPPTPPPTVRVVSVANIPLPQTPTAKIQPPDITINQSSPVLFQVEAKYVPLGSIAKLRITSDEALDQLVSSTPLTGTFALSTATITATLPTGPSRLWVGVDWTP